MIKAVIFDMDGVLIDSEIVYINHIYERLVKRNPEIKIEQLYPTVGSTNKRTKEIIFELAGEDLDSEEFNKEYETFFLDCSVDYPSILRRDVYDVLNYIKERGYKIGLASSTSPEGIENVVTSCGLKQYFDAIISGDMFKESKPHPEIYIHTSNLLNVSPENCLVIEDSNYGIKAACRAGMTVAAYKDERFAFDQSLAHYTIESLSEIPSLLDKLNTVI